MTYVSPQQTDNNSTTTPTSTVKSPELYGPALLMTARDIYSNYKKVHSRGRRSVIGVVIHQKTGRGQLVFQAKPVLLPYECFIPLEQIESTELN